ARGRGAAGARALGQARHAAELIAQRIATGLHDPRLARALARVRGPDAGHDLVRLQEAIATAFEIATELGGREIRVWPSGTHRLDADSASGELRCDRAHEADHRVFGQTVDRVVRYLRQSRKRGGDDDAAALRHDPVEPANPVHHAVHVDSECAAV